MDIRELTRKRAEYHSEKNVNDVQKITAFSTRNKEGGKTRTCSYCNASGLYEENSVFMLLEECRKKITDNADLDYVGVYLDDGGDDHKLGFQHMMEHAFEEKFDQIYTKSARWFANNIIDYLGYVDELKKLGINVFFEAEGVNSMELTSSIILVILAVAAQEESFSMLDSLECWQFRIPGLFKRPIKQIAVLSVNPDTAWTKEVNLVSWNGKDTQYDIREWSPDHDETGEGITLTNEEMEELKNIKE